MEGPTLLLVWLLLMLGGLVAAMQQQLNMWLVHFTQSRKRRRKVGGLWMEVQARMAQPASSSPLFWRSFRMQPADFTRLVAIVAPHIRHAMCPPAQFVGVCLYRLAHGHSVWHVAEEFDVAEGSVTNYTTEFVHIMTSPSVLSVWLKVPRGQALIDCMQQFRVWCGLPNVAGAADGKVFRLCHAPEARFFPAEYWAVRHKSKACYGINVLGVVDSKGSFVYACANHPGRVHDSAVFTASALYAELRGGRMWVAGVDGAFRPCLLVDSAYPLLPFTMKGYHAARNLGSAYMCYSCL
jgi:DDE superfamily endonuclease